VIEEARQALEEAPGTSIEHLSQQLDVSIGTCHSIVKKDFTYFPTVSHLFKNYIQLISPKN
jgi:hypothetical protein